MAPDSPAAPERLHALDALRGIALLLGVVLHASMSFFPVPAWIVVDPDTSPAASLLFFAIHLFRMITFFLIAGFFAHLVLERRGTAGFVRDRVKRIAGPLIAFWPVVFPAILAVMVWSAWIANGGTLPEAPPPPPLGVRNFPLTHLWFLWVLLIFYAVLLAGRGLVGRLDRRGTVGRTADRALRLFATPWGMPLVAAPAALALYLTPNWVMWFGIPTPDQSLIPNAAACAAFGSAFLFGYALRRRPERLAAFECWWPVHLLLALVFGGAALAVAGGPVPHLAPVADPAVKALGAVLYALAAFATTFAALGLSLRFLSGHRPALRYLADSSYWVYIMHLPLVLAAQVLAAQLGWPWPVKLVLVIVGCTSILLASYELLVRHSALGAFLNGRKVPRRKAAAKAVLAS